MRTLATALILTSFVGMAVFGIWGMAAHSSHTDNISVCLGSLTQGAVCPDGNPAASVGFHLNSFRVFSTSLLESGLYGVLALMFVLTFARMVNFSHSGIPIYIPAASWASRIKTFETSYQPFKQEKIFWSSLHENSPALVSGFRLSDLG